MLKKILVSALLMIAIASASCGYDNAVTGGSAHLSSCINDGSGCWEYYPAFDGE